MNLPIGIAKTLTRLIGKLVYEPHYIYSGDYVLFPVSNSDVVILITGIDLVVNKENLLPFLIVHAAIARLKLKGFL